MPPVGWSSFQFFNGFQHLLKSGPQMKKTVLWFEVPLLRRLDWLWIWIGPRNLPGENLPGENVGGKFTGGNSLALPTRLRLTGEIPCRGKSCAVRRNCRRKFFALVNCRRKFLHFAPVNCRGGGGS